MIEDELKEAQQLIQNVWATDYASFLLLDGGINENRGGDPLSEALVSKLA